MMKHRDAWFTESRLLEIDEAAYIICHQNQSKTELPQGLFGIKSKVSFISIIKTKLYIELPNEIGNMYMRCSHRDAIIYEESGKDQVERPMFIIEFLL